MTTLLLLPQQQQQHQQQQHQQYNLGGRRCIECFPRRFDDPLPDRVLRRLAVVLGDVRELRLAIFYDVPQLDEYKMI